MTDDDEVPTYVGVNPSFSTWPTVLKRSPHIRGGEPT